MKTSASAKWLLSLWNFGKFDNRKMQRNADNIQRNIYNTVAKWGKRKNPNIIYRVTQGRLTCVVLEIVHVVSKDWERKRERERVNRSESLTMVDLESLEQVKPRGTRVETGMDVQCTRTSINVDRSVLLMNISSPFSPCLQNHETNSHLQSFWWK